MTFDGNEREEFRKQLILAAVQGLTSAPCFTYQEVAEHALKTADFVLEALEEEEEE